MLQQNNTNQFAAASTYPVSRISMYLYLSTYLSLSIYISIRLFNLLQCTCTFLLNSLEPYFYMCVTLFI